MQNDYEKDDSTVTSLDNSSGDEYGIKLSKRVKKSQPDKPRKVPKVTKQHKNPKRHLNLYKIYLCLTYI